MNVHAIRAIYRFEMARTFRTLMQSIASPVLSTSLYFVVFGAAIGSRMGVVDGVSYGAFIIPGLIMLALLNESISNASFGIYLPKWSGTIYELLSAPVSYVEIVLAYVGAAASKSIPMTALACARSAHRSRATRSRWLPVGVNAPPTRSPDAGCATAFGPVRDSTTLNPCRRRSAAASVAMRTFNGASPIVWPVLVRPTPPGSGPP